MDGVRETKDWKKYSKIIRKQRVSAQAETEEQQPAGHINSGEHDLASHTGSQDTQSASEIDSLEALPLSPDEVLKAVTAVQNQVKDSEASFRLGGRTVVVRNVCDGIIDGLSTVKDFGALLASLNPFASMAWSGLQFFVQNLETAKEMRAMCWEVPPRATYLISRYQTFKGLYTSDPGLQQSRELLEQNLVDLYTLILNYQMAMVIHLKTRSQRIKTSFGQASNSPLQMTWESIKDKEATVAGLQALADRETDNAKFRKIIEASAELQGTLDKTWDEVQEISRYVDEQQRRDILH